MASTSRTTKDHDEIRNWAEERGGKPAHVSRTGSKSDIGILRIEFPGATASNDANLEEISWDQFFEKFDELGLALLYQEETAGGEKSNFNKLVSSETADEAEEGGRPAGSPARASSSRRKTAVKRVSGTGPASHGAGAGKKAAPIKNTAGTVKKSAASSRPGAGAKKVAPAKKSSAVKKSAASKHAGRSAHPAKKSAVKKSGRAGAAKKTAKAAYRPGLAKKSANKAPKTSAGRRPAAKKSAARKRR